MAVPMKKSAAGKKPAAKAAPVKGRRLATVSASAAAPARKTDAKKPAAKATGRHRT